LKKVQFVVTLNKAKMLEAARSGSRPDLRSLIESVPSATVVSGNPAVSVEVEVAPEHVDELRDTVRSMCTIGPYIELDLYGRRTRRG
jgi:hypothetical protein